MDNKLTKFHKSLINIFIIVILVIIFVKVVIL